MDIQFVTKIILQQLFFLIQIMHQLQKIDNDYLDTTYKDYLIMSGHVRRTGWYINL